MNTSTNFLFGLFVLGSSLLALAYETTFAFDRPVHSAVCVFLFTGSVLLASNRFFPSAFRDPSSSHLYDSIPLVDHPELHTESHAPTKRRRTTRFNLPTTWIICIVASCALCLRVELSRQITRNIECSRPSGAASIPFFVSLYDFWRNKRRKSVDREIPPDESMSDLIYFKVTRNCLRYIIPAALLMIGGLASASWRESWGSTYICPTVLGPTLRIPVTQGLCIALDVFLIVIAGELSHKEHRTYDGKERPLPVLFGFIYLAVALFWILVGFVVFIIRADQREWMFSLEPSFKRSVFMQSLLFTLLTVTATKTVSHFGVLTLSFLVTFTFVYVWVVTTLLVTRNPFPPLSTSHATFSIIAIFTGASLYLKTRTASVVEGRMFSRTCSLLRIVLLFCFGSAVTLLFLQHSKAYYHPIDLLIFDAKEKHQSYVAQATGSPNLQHAIWEYQRRYDRQPPPGFDKWYEFATTKSSVVIDDFDQIYEDLLPFQALTPEKLRQLTSQIVADPRNALAAISIRDGVVQPQGDILPTHKWMVDGVAKMISSFSHVLPDMDIAVNLNDECRVAIPWESLEYLKSVGRPSTPFERAKPTINTFSSDRASTWPPITKMTDEADSDNFIDRPFQPTFDGYGTAVCPPGSEARNSLFWDRHSLCVSCAQPHTLGQFVSNWTLAGDICHQPDLGYLHGFFLSPSSFRISQLPLPVFSQSKLQGFNDILYPSAWNYIDKVQYNPSESQPDLPYLDKQNTLFWRGGTSEGVSNGGTWKGMTRQRLLHLVNNNTLNEVSVLLPSDDPKLLTYYKIHGTAPHTKLNLQTDVNIGEKVTRCLGDDCGDQTEELGVAERLEFQDHWKYRYLFDMDGAGFSGRFLPFLQSNSVPFRTGLFRQWFDSRLTAWRHFVPVDIRLHGLWSTLAYFAGVVVEPEVKQEGKQEGEQEGEQEGGEEEGPQTVMNAHDLEGTLIAEEGRMWAEKVLRKEDMEVYLFRLLLEWGRLTDDQRDELGFTM